MTTDRIARLIEARRCLVRERAAIIAEATGCTYAEADELAYQQEGRAQRELPGVTDMQTKGTP